MIENSGYGHIDLATRDLEAIRMDGRRKLPGEGSGRIG
jgi:hypothetical protein